MKEMQTSKYITTTKFTTSLLAIVIFFILGIITTVYANRETSIDNKLNISIVGNDIKYIKEDIKDIKDILKKNYVRNP